MTDDRPVVSERFPYISVHLEIGEQMFDLEARLDTGLSAGLKVAATLLPDDLEPDSIGLCILEDERTVYAPVHRASVRIGPHGMLNVMVVALGSEPLIGREISDHFMVMLDHGSRLIIQP